MASAELLPVAALISGGGTTLVNLHREIEAGHLPVQIVKVVASRPCAGIDRCRELGLAVELLRPRGSATVAEYSNRVFERCRASGAKLTVLAGFLSRLEIPPDHVGSIMNIHPSLIPAFSGPGMFGRHVHAAVIERGCTISGCTVHFCDNEYDHGPIILQRAVPVLFSDTPETLAARVFEQECIAYPEAIRLFAAGRLHIEGRRVRID